LLTASGIISKVRRAIGDDSEPYTYSNTLMLEFVQDATVELGEKMGIAFSYDSTDGTISPSGSDDAECNALKDIFSLQVQEFVLDRKQIASNLGGVRRVSLGNASIDMGNLSQKLEDEKKKVAQRLVKAILRYNTNAGGGLIY